MLASLGVGWGAIDYLSDFFSFFVVYDRWREEKPGVEKGGRESVGRLFVRCDDDYEVPE
jgi:hypothetical protein